jgi:hypothetical protein
MSIDAMKQALEALEAAKNNHGVMLLSDPPQEAWKFHRVSERCSTAITALRQAIEQAEKQEPVAWEGSEGWESLAWELCADENGEEACTELIWEGGPIPEPWGDRWMKYEYEAKRLIALVQKHTSPPQRLPLTDEQIQYAFRTNSVMVDDGNAYMVAGKRAVNIARAIEAAHGIKGEA